MITVTRRAAGIRREKEFEQYRLQALRNKINNEEYLHEAIARIALILSNELLDIPRGGGLYERQRARRK